MKGALAIAPQAAPAGMPAVSWNERFRLIAPEVTRIRVRTGKTMALSLAAHAVLIVFLLLYPQISPGPVGVTEISWLEAGEPGAAAPAEAAPAPVNEERGFAVKRQPETVSFAREESPDATIAPEPQDASAAEDRLSERLASLQRESRHKNPVQPLVVATPGGMGLPGSAGTGLAMVGGGMGSGPRGLARGEGGGGGGGGVTRPRPIEMKRATERPVTPLATALPRPEPPAAAQRKTEETVAERTLAGATLTGPVADRRLLSHATPRYPEWAKREGVEAVVRLTFFVTEAGLVKENVVVQKTSGYQDFDVNAIEALKTWRFAPMPKDAVGEQWGEITFRYRLSDAGKE